MNYFSSIFALVLSGSAAFSQTDNDLRAQLQEILRPYDATVGISVKNLDTGDTLTINGEKHYATMSVYKLPLGMAIIDRIRREELSIYERVHVTKEDLRPNTWSPLRDEHPEGNIDITVGELLNYAVSQSDNNACDLLFKLAGGTKAVDTFVHNLGITDMTIVSTETEMAANVPAQGTAALYANWSTPAAMTQLLETYFLSEQDDFSDYMTLLMIQSPTGPNRIRGLLPTGMWVAHKTGTSGSGNDGVIVAVNDVGVLLPAEGKRIALSVFVSDSKEDFATSELIIAKVAKAVYDHYLGMTVGSYAIELEDTARERKLPLLLYDRVTESNHKVALLTGTDHAPDQLSHYRFIADELAAQGYLVVSVGSDLLSEFSDEATSDDISRGEADLLFVREVLRERYPDRNFDSLLLIGRGNGGDIVIQLAKDHPETVIAVIALNHRQLSVPVDGTPVLCIRSQNFIPRKGVVPSRKQQKKYGIRVVQLGPNPRNGSLDDTGSDELKQQVLKEIGDFLKKDRAFYP